MPAFLANNFTLVDPVDQSKTSQFVLSGLTTNTSPRLSLPVSSTTLAGLSLVQTFSAQQNFTADVYITPATDVPALTLTRTGAQTVDLLQCVDASADANTWVDYLAQLHVRNALVIDYAFTSYSLTLNTTLASADRTQTFPDADGTVALVGLAQTWTALQTFKDTTFKLVDDGDATKTAVFSLGGASANADLTLAWAGTADRTVTIPDATTTLAGLAVAQTFTAAQTITPATDVVNLKLQAGAGQTANLLEAYDETPALAMYIDSAGGLAVNGISLLYSSYVGTLSPGTLTANRTWTFPNGSYNMLGHSGAPTAGRVFFAGSTTGQASTDADLTFATDTLTVTKIGTTTMTGTTTFSGRAVLPMGEISYFSTTGTAIVISGTSDGSTNMVKAAPTTALTSGGTDFDNGGSNNGRLRYTGTTTKMFHVACTVTISPDGANDTFVLGLAKDGTVLATSKVLQKVGTGGDAQSTALHVMVELATNSYLEFYVGNITDADDLVIKSLNLFAMGM